MYLLHYLMWHSIGPTFTRRITELSVPCEFLVAAHIRHTFPSPANFDHRICNCL